MKNMNKMIIINSSKYITNDEENKCLYVLKYQLNEFTFEDFKNEFYTFMNDITEDKLNDIKHLNSSFYITIYMPEYCTAEKSIYFHIDNNVYLIDLINSIYSEVLNVVYEEFYSSEFDFYISIIEEKLGIQ
jgi:hypothetical protein